ncbi:MAG: squalene/phytoene synthase family protein [Spirochaetota bacterium]
MVMNDVDEQPAVVPSSPGVSASPQYVRDLLRRTSRTFALSIEQLPRPLCDELSLAYLLLRVSDYLEDHPSLPAAKKVELLDAWEHALRDRALLTAFSHKLSQVEVAGEPAEAEAARSAPVLLDRLDLLSSDARGIILAHVIATTKGMGRWQAHSPEIADEAEMDDYMHQVAGIVGYLITDLFACYSRRIERDRTQLLPLAREFGLALQSVNVIRGLRKDYERGWIFVPRTFCAAVGLVGSELFSADQERPAMEVVERLVAKAERHLRCALEYVSRLPRRLHRLRLACMWPLLFAAGTLGESRENPAVLRSEAKISRSTVKGIVAKTKIFGWSNAWLSSYTGRLVRG